MLDDQRCLCDFTISNYILKRIPYEENTDSR